MANRKLHEEICKELADIYVDKNRDYGSSFSDQFEEFGLLSAAIRMDDKIRRIKQLVNNDPYVKSESVRDSIMDLANYAVMTAMELESENRNETWPDSSTQEISKAANSVKF